MAKDILSRGFPWKLFGIIQIVLAYCAAWLVFFLIADKENGSAAIAGYLALLLLATLLWRSGNKAVFRGKRIGAARRHSRFAQIPQHPVVYLRSFKDDTPASEPIILMQAYSGNPAVQTPAYISFTTEEEQLAAVMSGVGPFVAIGRPGEELPELGAYRIYAREDEWQEGCWSYVDCSTGRRTVGRDECSRMGNKCRD